MSFSQNLGVSLLTAFAFACSEKNRLPEPVAKGKEVNETEPASPPTKEESIDAASSLLPQEFKVSLTQGRKHGKEGRYMDAVHTFEKALEVVPGDPRALSELAWARYRLGDLDRALLECKRAIAASESENHKAAALYTLGRIREDRGEMEQARSAYELSHSLRPRISVEKRLANLSTSPKKKTNTESLNVLGPFATLRDFCQRYTGDSIVSSHFGGRVGCDPRPRVILQDVQGKIRGAQVFEMRATKGGTSATANQLAIELTQGWYVVLDAVFYPKNSISLRDDNASLAIVGEKHSRLRFVFPASSSKTTQGIECKITEERPQCQRLR